MTFLIKELIKNAGTKGAAAGALAPVVFRIYCGYTTGEQYECNGCKEDITRAD